MAKRKVSAWNKFVATHRKKGKTLKQISAMWKKKSGKPTSKRKPTVKAKPKRKTTTRKRRTTRKGDLTLAGKKAYPKKKSTTTTAKSKKKPSTKAKKKTIRLTEKNCKILGAGKYRAVKGYEAKERKRKPYKKRAKY